MYSSALRFLALAMAAATANAGCETAFAANVNFDPSKNGAHVGNQIAPGSCFIGDTDGPGSGRWGWKLGELSTGTYSVPIFEGAGQCKVSGSRKVGDLSISVGPSSVTVSATSTAYGHVFQHHHLYVGCAPYPTGSSGSVTVAPGQYTNGGHGNSGSHGAGTTSISPITVAYSGCTSPYVIFHAVTVEAGSGETCGADEDDTPTYNGGGGDDPHFKTWAGDWFDYMGQCDLVLTHAPAFAQGLGLDVHIRTSVRYDYSFISNAALKIDDEIFEVASYGEYLLNGIAGVEMPAMIAGYPISYNKVDAHTTVFSVEIGQDEYIRFKTYKDFVTVKFEGAKEQDFADSVGLMGEFNTLTMTSRDGTQLDAENVNALAQEWQVRDTDAKLFQVSDRFPQYPSACVLPSPTEKKTSLRLNASVN